MKKVLTFLFVMGLACSLYATGKNAGFQLIEDSSTVRDTNTAYSDPVMVAGYSDLSFVFTIHSGTSTDLKLEYQIIDSNQSNYAVLASTNDASVDADYYGTWTDVQTLGTLVSSLTSGKIADGMSVPVTRWIRFKVTGNVSNAGATTYSITIGRYKERP